jgi:hypothetical protein
MSKAEEAAYKAYPYNGDYRGQGDSNSKIREAYIEGYHQADKDKELTSVKEEVGTNLRTLLRYIQYSCKDIIFAM